MMKTMFVTAPFGNTGLGVYSPPVLGQAPTTPAATPASSGSTGDLMNVSRGIEGLLAQLPSDTLGTYQTEYKRCQDLLNKGGLVGLASGGKCLYDLYEKLKDLAKNQPAKAPSPIPYVAPQESFPIIPVGLVAVGGIALIYGLSKMG
jgi:hypothetical protein